LRSAIEFAVIRCKGEMLKVDDLPPEIRIAPLRSPAEGQAIEGIAADEGQRILAALRQSGGNRAAAARLLGIGRTTLYRRLESLTADRSMISGQPP
jgi:transcriptional regulator of acetoin/glycerol metabolism